MTAAQRFLRYIRYDTQSDEASETIPSTEKQRSLGALIAQELRKIYPLPNKVRAESTTAIGEVRRVRAPSVFIELGYHDNPDDAAWIQSNLDAAARSIALALTEYFGLPFLEPRPPRTGVVDVSWGYLNIRDRPDRSAPVVAQAVDGTRVTVVNRWENWLLVRLGEVLGWASADFVTLL